MVWEMSVCLRGPEDPRPPCMCVRRAHTRAPGCLGHRRLRPVVRRPEARGQGACRAGFSRGPSPRCDPRPSPAPPGLPVSACMPSALLARMLGPPPGTSCDLDDVFKDPQGRWHSVGVGLALPHMGLKQTKFRPRASSFSKLCVSSPSAVIDRPLSSSGRRGAKPLVASLNTDEKRPGNMKSVRQASLHGLL